ncbi:MAG: tRNA-dihydrouridine synthase [Planctomycetaceae bacterium]|nr:tRNA-dihydrouridine synthase [Planctomycetaceae bacterium]
MTLDDDARKMLTIGGLSIRMPVVQAALSGYSDWPMRTIARELGAPYTICEVMIDTFVSSLKDRQRTRRFLKVTEQDHPVGAQLMGALPEEFPGAAVRLVDAGFDVIDVNFGCPLKKQRGRCRGGMHLGQPDVAIAILKAVRSAVPSTVPVTVKMRRGVDDSENSLANFLTIFDAACDLGYAAVTVHGRTVQQKYNGPSQWDFLTDLKARYPRQTILGSGDLFTAVDCVRMLKETRVDGVTAARGAIGNPWIFQQAEALLLGQPLPAPPTVFEQRDVILRHFQLAREVYPAELVSRQMRKFGIRYASLHPATNNVRDAFIGVRSDAEWMSVMETWYSDDQPGVMPTAQQICDCKQASM